MNTDAARRALRSMGYQERKPGHWLKPIGFQCFTYHEGKDEWCNWFRTVDGEIQCWQSHQLHDNGQFEPPSETWHYVIHLKEFECWTRTDMYVDGKSQFQLEERPWEDLL